MPSGYTSGFEGRVLLDTGVVYYKKQGGDGNPTRLGVSVGGCTFEPGIEWRHIEFDGKRSDIEGLHRIVGRTGVIRGTFLIELPKHIPIVEPGATEATQSNITTWTPRAASTLLSPNTEYLQDVRLIATKPDGSLVEVKFARGLVTKWSWVQEDKNEHKLADLEISAVLEDATAASSTDTAPYVYIERATIS
jgi:hypothetical protein